MEYLKICKLLCDLKTWFGIFENWFVFWELIFWFENWFVFSKLICDLKTWFVFWKLIWAEAYVIWERVGPLANSNVFILLMDWKLLPKRNVKFKSHYWLLYINDWRNCPFRSPQFDIGMEGETENSDVRTFKCATF